MLILMYLCAYCALQHSAVSLPSRQLRDIDESDSDEQEEIILGDNVVANGSCSFPSPRSTTEKTYAAKECQQLKRLAWKEAYRKCCLQQKGYEPVCGSRHDGTYGTIYYNECSLYRDRIVNPCILVRPGYHRDCQRCAMKQEEPPPCDLDLQSYDMMCTSDLFEYDDNGQGRCTVPRCMSDLDKITIGRECQKLKEVDWEEAFRKCCQQRKQHQVVCGSRHNGTMGTYYYNRCAIIKDSYLHPNECILERIGEHDDCKRCGIELMKAPDCMKDIVGGPTYTRPLELSTRTPLPTQTPRSLPRKDPDQLSGGRKGCTDVRKSYSYSNGDNNSDDDDNDSDDDDDDDGEDETEEDIKCSELKKTNWEEELIRCCQQRKRPQKVCGSRRNGTYGTFTTMSVRLLKPDIYIQKNVF
ncbi:uncharacterized protein [Amphiura filiformis]|uniref:uncharacterized protein n=1 Tax=Amphiura filiformis TaxID=82378 RepID=UPI003B213041